MDGHDVTGIEPGVLDHLGDVLENVAALVDDALRLVDDELTIAWLHPVPRFVDGVVATHHLVGHRPSELDGVAVECRRHHFGVHVESLGHAFDHPCGHRVGHVGAGTRGVARVDVASFRVDLVAIQLLASAAGLLSAGTQVVGFSGHLQVAGDRSISRQVGLEMLGCGLGNDVGPVGASHLTGELAVLCERTLLVGGQPFVPVVGLAVGVHVRRGLPARHRLHLTVQVVLDQVDDFAGRFFDRLDRRQIRQVGIGAGDDLVHLGLDRLLRIDRVAVGVHRLELHLT